MLRLLVLLTLLCALLDIQAQEDDWQAFVDEFALDEDYAESEEWQDYLLDLKQINEQPLNINTATREDLQRLPFLTDEQIEDIHAYIYLHGEMRTLNELLMVRSLDAMTRRWLRLFVYAEPLVRAAAQPMLKHLTHDFSTRVDIPLYYRRGQLVQNGYRGDALYHRMRYELSNKFVRAGLRIEKDAGERYYDSHGGYAMVKNRGIVHRAIVGDYRAAYGEGLVMGCGTWHVKSTPSARRLAGLHPMTGTSESGFLRGAAISLNVSPQWQVAAFLSHLGQDATLNAEGEVKTLLTSGYHRTQTEFAKRHNIRSTTAGAALTWQRRTAYVGATGYFQRFSPTLNPGDDLYRRYYPRGDRFGVAGIFYGYAWRTLTVGGETAFDLQQHGIATLNRATFRPNGRHTLTILQRYYDASYYSFHASAMGEASRVQNESGVMLHWRATPWYGWQLMAFADVFYHRWPMYGMTHSMMGQEMMGEASYAPNERHAFSVSYRWKNKEANDQPDAQGRMKLQWTFTPTAHLNCTLRSAIHHTPTGVGWGIQSLVHHRPESFPLGWSAAVAYARTPDYQSRIYLMEPSLYQTPSYVSLYGHSLRATLSLRCTLWGGRLMLEGRYGMLRFLDRSTQSSSLQTIYSPWKNDIQLQVRVKV